MNYIIENEINFNTDNGSLKNLKSGDEFFLSNFNTRVFKYLLEHGVEPISREEIFSHLWKDDSFSTASAKLNQYISLTRRALIRSGLKNDLIITVAKKGYRINRSVSVKILTIESADPAFEPIIQEAVPTKFTNEKATKPYLKSNVNLLHGLYFLVPVFIIIVFFYYYNNKSEIPISYMGDINGCKVYIPGREGEHSDEFRLLSKNNLYGNYCSKNEVVIAQVNSFLGHIGDNSHQFIAKCLMDSNNLYHHCENKYIREWKRK